MVAGSASLEPDVPVTPETTFEAASLSKPVFAWLVVALADEGALDLDRPLAETFDYARLPDKAAYARLTPRMILTHRTGLPNWVDEQADFFERTAPVPFGTPPGAAYSYSGEAFQLLQAYVEDATGRRSSTSSATGSAASCRARRSPGRSPTASPRRGGTAPRATRRPAATWTTWATAARPRTRSLRRPGTTPPSCPTCAAARGCSPEACAEMLRPQSPVPDGAAPYPTSYGLGWTVSDLGAETFVGHGGNNGAYKAFAGFVRESGDGLVVLTNGERGQDLIDVILTPPAPPVETGLSAPEATFEAFWATYNEGYALFGVKHVDWGAVYDVYRPRVTAETTDDELWAVLAEVGGLLNDVHVTLRDPETGREARSGGRSIGVGPFDDGTFSLDLVAEAYAYGRAGERCSTGRSGTGGSRTASATSTSARSGTRSERARDGRNRRRASRARGAWSSMSGTTAAATTGRARPLPAGSWPSLGAT